MLSDTNIPLVIRNEDDFKHIPGLDLRNPFATTPRTIPRKTNRQCLLAGTDPKQELEIA
jgi:hypothetical protein